ncbi:MAG TPA: flavodoxin family protein [Desulfobacterales bacterium]
MIKLTAIYGSPRRKGNTAVLLKHAVQGARRAGALVEEVMLRDLKMSPCLEIYGCKKNGRCVIRDEFARVRDAMLAAEGIMLASPIFFYTVSAQVKILMDRCQSLWVQKYWIEKRPFSDKRVDRSGMFISVGATRGKMLFEGALRSVRYFYDVLDTELWRSLLYRGLDFEGDVFRCPQYLEEAYRAGRELVDRIRVRHRLAEDSPAR